MTSGHEPQPAERGLLRRSLPMLGAVRGLITLLLVLSLVVSALPYVSAAVLGPLVQVLAEAGESGSLSRVWDLTGPLSGRADPAGPLGFLATPLPFAALLVTWVATVVLAQLLYLVNAWVRTKVERVLIVDIRQRVHDHLQTLSLDFFSGARSGVLIPRVTTETAGVQRILTDCLIPPLADVVVFIIALGYLLAMSWQMTIAALVLSPLALMTVRYATQHVQQATQRALDAEREMAGQLEETVSGMAGIQINNLQDLRSTGFRQVSEKAARSSASITMWMQATANSAQIYITLSTVLVLLVGIVFGSSFGLTFAALVVFMGMVPTMFGAVQRVMGAYTTYRSVAPSARATYELLDARPSVQDRPGAKAIDAVQGNIELSDVSFGYTSEQKVLDGLSLSAHKGETVALVGGIGSGKSTVFNLLLRLIEPQRGRILLDGQDIRTITLASLREHVGKLPQFPYFIKDSIRENIRLARPEATDAEVEDACRRAGIHSVITDPSTLRDGYDTVMDVQVPSGGQKRLIALARCLLREPEVLLLDEPTENLDAAQRVRLIDVIREYASDRTCMVVSHDLDFIAAVADRILVLEHGHVTQMGDHRTLMAQDGLYKRLFEAKKVDPDLVRPPQVSGMTG